MRTLVGIIVLLLGIASCLLDTLAHKFTEAQSISLIQNYARSLPDKRSYTKEEVMDVVWQVWTNKISLPEQNAYTRDDLKASMSKTFFGAEQFSCDRSGFEYAIAKTAGLSRDDGRGATVFGVIAMLIGAFILGGVSDRKVDAPKRDG
jgi:hypothetical protein